MAERKDKEIVPYEEGVFAGGLPAKPEEISQRLEQFGYPKEAMPTFLLAAQKRQQLVKELREQLKMKPEAQMKIFKDKLPPDTVITSDELKEVKKRALAFGVPLDRFTFLTFRGKKVPWLSLTGKEERLIADCRLLKDYTYVDEIITPLPDGNVLVSVKCIIRFFNNSEFHGLGADDLTTARLEEEKRRPGVPIGVGQVVQRARSRAFNEAFRKAEAAIGGIETEDQIEFERYAEAVEGIVIPEEPIKVLEVPTTLPQLIAKLKLELNITPKKAEELLGQPLASIKDYGKAWEELKEKVK